MNQAPYLSLYQPMPYFFAPVQNSCQAPSTAEVTKDQKAKWGNNTNMGVKSTSLDAIYASIQAPPYNPYAPGSSPLFTPSTVYPSFPVSVGEYTAPTTLNTFFITNVNNSAFNPATSTTPVSDPAPAPSTPVYTPSTPNFSPNSNTSCNSNENTSKTSVNTAATPPSNATHTTNFNFTYNTTYNFYNSSGITVNNNINTTEDVDNEESSEEKECSDAEEYGDNSLDNSSEVDLEEVADLKEDDTSNNEEEERSNSEDSDYEDEDYEDPINILIYPSIFNNTCF